MKPERQRAHIADNTWTFGLLAVVFVLVRASEFVKLPAKVALLGMFVVVSVMATTPVQTSAPTMAPTMNATMAPTMAPACVEGANCTHAPTMSPTAEESSGDASSQENVGRVLTPSKKINVKTIWSHMVSV